jgi:CYTH domain-containing protein
MAVMAFERRLTATGSIASPAARCSSARPSCVAAWHASSSAVDVGRQAHSRLFSKAICAPAPFGENVGMRAPSKDARIERERRFLLQHFPSNADVVRVRRVSDRYIDGTTLRLRELREDGQPSVFKLTQKIPARASGAQQGWITTMHLTKEEFSVLAQLPAQQLSKSRYSVPPFGIDVFEGALQGLVLAEAEFDSAVAAGALVTPSFLLREVSDDDRFAGGRLVRASREEIQVWLSEHGIELRCR